MHLLAEAVHTTGINWESVGVIISAIALIVSPLLIFLIRVTQRWTKVEVELANAVELIREDRLVTDKRLRWLEENVWKGKR